MKKVLILVDYQNDFVTGILGTPEAISIAPNINAKIKEYKENGDLIIATRDTHNKNYLDTLEGKKLPIPHCIQGTEGWDFAKELTDTKFDYTIDKNNFGYYRIGEVVEIVSKVNGVRNIDVIEFIGVCTDICVISNVMILRASIPDIPIIVDANCCAGTSIEAHNMALRVMQSCQIDIIGGTSK